MAAGYFGTLLLGFVTTQLLLEGQAAYLDRPEWDVGRMSQPPAEHSSFDAMTDFSEAARTENQLFDAVNAQENFQSTDQKETDQVQHQDYTPQQDTAVSEAETCSEEFHEQLIKLMESKKSCKSAGFYDCCQVKNLIPLSANGTYDFTRFCNAPCEPFSSAGTDFTLHGYCDMSTDEGGWLVVQKRIPGGTVNFTRTWEEYETGFGNLDEEFWYGLRNLHCLTTRNDMELRIDMVTKTGDEHYTTTADTFAVGGAGEKYKLTVGGAKGFYITGLTYHNNQPFSTYDQDNDKWPKNCAYASSAGWWFNACYHSNLNGPHVKPTWPDTPFSTITWSKEMASVEMKIRPKNCFA